MRFLTRGVERFDRVTRQPLPVAAVTADVGLDRALSTWIDSDVLELVHFLVFDLYAEQSFHVVEARAAIDSLETTLSEDGSAWRVAQHDQGAGLEKRVPQGVADAAALAMQSTSGGDHLSAAWTQAFGRSLAPSRAYHDAIVAVEAAVIPVVQPKNSKATLGTVIGQMRNDADWALPIEHADRSVVLRMCEQLWGGQTDRHGANNSHPPSQGAAEAAVLVAVALVQWFSSGQVARRP